MAGAGHGSVTGLDERTLGRIDVILFDADYRDAGSAIEDAWRVAVFATDPRMRAEHDRVRAAAVRSANERRDPTAASVKTSTGVHRALLGVALFLGAVAVALIATPRNSPVTLQDALLPAGLLAVISVSLLWWLEPRRANGSLWGSRVPAVIHFIFGMLWLLAAAGALTFRWGEVEPYRALPATSGLTMLVCAGVAAIILWVHALRADRSGRQTGLARLTGDLVDPQDAAEVFDELDRWWWAAGPEAMRRDGARVRRVRREVLARLRAAALITERDERTAAAAPEPARWSGRRR
ncbi:hypothetical protein [Microbacterium terricola]|uniref:Uncharacterized protein n=1 Tax=Microbacterium terricola TaxID=344163 RepID=A0ABM8DV83_9MICO|nr:hypothetical protein [Microbacterium terricola]UYK39673.1 hypothetical protein OAU46_13365 [Microbacterium terricola]BDV29584.1 hypothetical protein Microterr_02440 [Microbacterium terricola]